MSTNKLEVYNRALDLIGEQRLVHLSQLRLSRHALDNVYDFVLSECLSQGMWFFAMRVSSLTSTSLPTPDFGFNYAFAIPSDRIYPYMLFKTAEGLIRLDDYTEISDVYLTRVTPVYLEYTSNDASYGKNLTNWPYPFARYVTSVLASKICYQITRNAELCMKLEELSIAWLQDARMADGLVSTPGLPAYNTIERRQFNAGANTPEIWPFPSQASVPQ